MKKLMIPTLLLAVFLVLLLTASRPVISRESDRIHKEYPPISEMLNRYECGIEVDCTNP